MEKHIFETYYVWNPSACRYENGKDLPSIINDSVITCMKLHEKKKMFQQILMKTETDFCYLIKYRTKSKCLLRYHIINKKLREVR